MDPIPINLAVEYPVSEALILAILDQSGRPFFVTVKYNRGGFGYIRKHIGSFNKAAEVGNTYLILTDLDQAPCSPELIAGWINRPRHANLLFRVAVKEAESWVIADREAFARRAGARSASLERTLRAIRNFVPIYPKRRKI